MRSRVHGPRLGVALIAGVLVLWSFGGTAAPEDNDESAKRPVLVVQTGHALDVTSATFSSGGRHVLTSSWDGTAALWETDTGSLVRRFLGHATSLFSATFSSDDKYVLTSSDDGTARLWEAATGTAVQRFEGHSDRVVSAVLSSNGEYVLTGSYDQTARLFGAATGKEVRCFGGHEGIVVSATFSPDGHHVLTASSDNTARLWDTQTGKELRRFEGHAFPVTSAAFSPDGKYALTSSWDRTARLWDTATGAEVRRFEGHADGLLSCTFSRDGRLLVTSSADRTARLWNTATGAEVRRFKGHADRVVSATLSPDGKLVLTVSEDERAVRLWDTATGIEVQQLTGHAEAVFDAAFSPDRRHIVTGGGSGAYVWTTDSGTQVRHLEGHAGRVLSVTFSRDSSHVLTGSVDGTARLWHTSTGQEVRRFEGHEGIVFSATLAPDGTFVLTGSEDTDARLWATATGKLVRHFTGHWGPVRTVAFSHDGTLVLTGSEDRTARIWESATGREVHSLVGHTALVNSVAFSPDGAHVLTGGDDSTVRLWEADTGSSVPRFETHTDSVASVTFSPDGLHFLTGSHDGTARLWDAKTWREMKRFEGHTARVGSAAFSDDGVHAVTTGEDSTTRIWSTATGRQLCALVSLTNGSWAVVAADGRFDMHDVEAPLRARWVLPDEPMRTYPIEIFMRDYYEPRLLARLLAGEEMKAVPDLSKINRVQPGVRIVAVEPDPERPSLVSVAVEVESLQRELLGNDKPVTSGARDLRLFRDGRLVAWKDGPLDLKDGKATVVLKSVRLWCPDDQTDAEFSSYAFNADRVKSETVRMKVAVPPELRGGLRTTSVVATGIDRSQQPEWNLSYAVSDAKALLKSLGDRMKPVVPVLLENATKAEFRDRLLSLADKAEPQDLVVISMSTHGITGSDGEFYLLPADVAPRDDQGEWLASCISAEELTHWLRPIDAEMVMIIDACQSAASVEKEGFKPGPMGSSGLGQLAYSKRMRILAASQAAEVALESGEIQHGLLTYALTKDGLEKGRADFEPKDGEVLLGEWLRYAAQRVPTLAEEVRNGNVRAVGRGGFVPRENEPEQMVQTPSLFDYARRGTRDVVLVGE